MSQYYIDPYFIQTVSPKIDMSNIDDYFRGHPDYDQKSLNGIRANNPTATFTE